MIYSRPIANPLPPRLSMDEYADFLEASLRDCDPARAAWQKGLEERIQTPFRMGGRHTGPPSASSRFASAR